MSFPVSTPQVTIAVSAALSAAAEIGHGRLVGVILPASTEGASITFQASVDGATFYDVQDGEAELSRVAAAGQYIVIEPPLRAPYIKVRTGTSGSPTNQSGADALITLVVYKDNPPAM